MAVIWEEKPELKMIRPAVIGGLLVDRGKDPGPGKDPKAQEIDIREGRENDN
jgi:hypothetical protein